MSSLQAYIYNQQYPELSNSFLVNPAFEGLSPRVYDAETQRLKPQTGVRNSKVEALP
jgi:hypothetical protein